MSKRAFLHKIPLLPTNHVAGREKALGENELKPCHVEGLLLGKTTKVEY
jgi:hypothetical protein